jgi:hypothetical protein
MPSTLVGYEQRKSEIGGVAANADGTNWLRCFVPFIRAHEMLIDENRSCVERVTIAWQDLRNIRIEELPPSLRAGWTEVSERVERLLAATSNPPAAATIEEAGDIGCILLCIETLLRRGVGCGVERAA